MNPRMQGRPAFRGALALAAGLLVASAAADDAVSRFEVSDARIARAGTTDGPRYAIDAQFTRTIPASHDARYVIQPSPKAANATCTAPGDALFANGFE